MSKIPKRKETATLQLSSQLATVHVFRPKNFVTVVADVDDIDVRDGSLLLIKRAANGRETCMMVFSPGCCFALAINSPSELTPSDGCTASTTGWRELDYRQQVLHRIEVKFVDVRVERYWSWPATKTDPADSWPQPPFQCCPQRPLCSRQRIGA